MLTALVAVVTGDVYERYADQMFASAEKFFHPTDEVEFITLYGREGWPEATGYRYNVLLETFPRANYIYLIDADMRFEQEIGEEILPGEFGITATEHPGYVGFNPSELPYEKDQESAAYIRPPQGKKYFCGGFVGGERTAMRILATQIASIIQHDLTRLGRWPIWHDESALNCVLASFPPRKTLSPSYCHPENSEWYEKAIWGEKIPRKIVALDKPAHERSGR